jgi:hypothetical protein
MRILRLLQPPLWRGRPPPGTDTLPLKGRTINTVPHHICTYVFLYHSIDLKFLPLTEPVRLLFNLVFMSQWFSPSTGAKGNIYFYFFTKKINKSSLFVVKILSKGLHKPRTVSIFKTFPVKTTLFDPCSGIPVRSCDRSGGKHKPRSTHNLLRQDAKIEKFNMKVKF